MIIWWILLIVLLGALAYWLLITTEGVYLGRRVVVWLYDLTAEKYDNIKQFDAETEEVFLVRPLLETLPHPAPRILDVATGTGRLPYFGLNEPTFNGRFIGLDASAGMLGQAQNKLASFGGRSSLVLGMADQLPFPTSYFDAVTCLEALEFFPAETAALQEMVRVLKPGGILLTTRRRGWEGKAFIGRYKETAEFETLLATLGLENVQTFAWQVNYDQVFAQKQ